MTLRDESDLVVARRHVRELGSKQGLDTAAVEALATAVTEVARNAVVHASGGEIELRAARAAKHAGRSAVVVIVRDVGPGIPDVEAALQDGFTTGGGGLGMGLPGARRLVDRFEIWSVVGRGTTITLEKWAR